MRITILISIATLFIVGCATSPPLPKIESTRGDRVGVLIEIGDSPSHTHIGTTIFNDFAKKYPYNWNLSSDVTHAVEQTVRNSGFTAVDLRAEGIQYSDVSGLIQASGEKWQIASGKEDTMRRLRDQLHLKALLILKETRVMARNGERYAGASGLYTRSSFGLTSYNAVAAYEWNVFVLDPIADAAKTDPLRSMLQISETPLLGFKDPANFENLTEAEFSPVRDAILQFIEIATTEAIKTLNVK